MIDITKQFALPTIFNLKISWLFSDHLAIFFLPDQFIDFINRYCLVPFCLAFEILRKYPPGKLFNNSPMRLLYTVRDFYSSFPTGYITKCGRYLPWGFRSLTLRKSRSVIFFLYLIDDTKSIKSIMPKKHLYWLTLRIFYRLPYSEYVYFYSCNVLSWKAKGTVTKTFLLFYSHSVNNLIG